MKPLVSVIIPVYNGSRFIRTALESVLQQDYRPIEIIVADDGSTDGTADIAETFEGVRVLRLGRVGVSKARNVAIAESLGEYLAFLDADDRWFEHKLSSQVAVAAAHPEAAFVLCKQLHTFECPVPDWFRGPTDGTESIAFEPSAWLMPRTTFEAVGGFDESRSLAEDTHWLSRAWDLGLRHVVDPGIHVVRRIHSDNATGRILSHRRAIFDILKESIERKRLRTDAQ